MLEALDRDAVGGSRCVEILNDPVITEDDGAPQTTAAPVEVTDLKKDSMESPLDSRDASLRAGLFHLRSRLCYRRCTR
jgi:hypothetical protein